MTSILTERFKTIPSSTYAYTLCGWHTHSDIPLTSLPTSPLGACADVRIQIASGDSPLPKFADWAIFEHSDECSLIGIQGVADFEVRGGKQIRVWPAAGASTKEMEIFLLGPAWAALCHQRRLLPLHASAILTRGGITAFAGHTGAGKSTIAALMDSSGYEMVADDILPISFAQNSVAGAWPYLRRLKLQGDSITALALTPAELVSETLDKEKYFVRPKYGAKDTWNRLERLYLLEIDPTASSISIDRIKGADAVGVLIDQTYHYQFIRGSGQFRYHLALCTRLAAEIEIYRLRRAPSFDAMHELRSLICEHLETALT